jgi:hypothetical protein
MQDWGVILPTPGEAFAREVLEQGLFWRVGNGDNICIWRDKWLPKPSSFRVQSLVAGLQPDAKVSCLIDHNLGGWNVPLI